MSDVNRLIDSGWKGVIYSAGASQLVATLGTAPGASQTLLESTLPYNQASMSELLGYSPESHCSELVAAQLAMAAFLRARQLSDHPNLYGLGVTASLRTTQPKRGEHRAFVGVQTSTSTESTKLLLQKGKWSRQKEESYIAKSAIVLLNKAIQQPRLSDPNGDETTIAIVDDTISRLLDDKPTVVGSVDGAVLPGAFNPLHQGHRMMRDIAQNLLRMQVQYELSVKNVDKPPLDFIDILSRRKQFETGELVLTNLPTFVDKAQSLFPNGRGVFVVGTDTLKRIGQIRYYPTSRSLEDAISLFREQEIRFLVFGRHDGSHFVSLDDVEIPSELRDLCIPVSETDFRDDISSTSLRKSGKSLRDSGVI